MIFYQDDYAAVHLGDARQILAELPEHSVDMVMTSPPYFGLRSYKCEPSIWIDRNGKEYTKSELDSLNCKHEWGDGKERLLNLQAGNPEFVRPWREKATDTITQGQFCLKCHAWRGVLGMEPTPDLYIQHLVGIFDLVRKVLKPTGTIWVNLGDSYAGGGPHHGDKNLGKSGKSYGSKTGQDRFLDSIPAKSLIGIPARFQIAMIDKGWINRNVIVWWKRSCMPESVSDRFTRDFEHVFMFSAKKDYYFEQQFEQYTAPLDRWGGDTLIANGHSTWDEGTGQNAYRDRDMRPNSLGRNARTVWHGNEPLPYQLKDNIPKEQLEWLIKTFCEPYIVPQGDVWDVTSQGTGLEHYASYPLELCRRPILAGCPEYICPKCGKPRVKMYSREILEQLDDHPYCGEGQLRSNGTEGGQGIQHSTLGGQQDKIKNEFIGYSDCGCKGADGKPIPLEQCVPGVVLDCFAGTGTTGVMAKLLGRKSVLIDVSETYCQMSVKRLKSVVRQGKLK